MSCCLQMSHWEAHWSEPLCARGQGARRPVSGQTQLPGCKSWATTKSRTKQDLGQASEDKGDHGMRPGKTTCASKLLPPAGCSPRWGFSSGQPSAVPRAGGAMALHRHRHRRRSRHWHRAFRTQRSLGQQPAKVREAEEEPSADSPSWQVGPWKPGAQTHAPVTGWHSWVAPAHWQICPQPSPKVPGRQAVRREGTKATRICSAGAIPPLCARLFFSFSILSQDLGSLL